MNLLKKLVLGVSIFTFAGALSAQEVSFTNKVSSDLVGIEISEDGSSAEFAGIKNNTKFEYSSDKLDAGFEMTFWAFSGKDAGDNAYFAIAAEDGVLGIEGWCLDDYWAEYRPVELLGIGLHRSYLVSGSYLPVEDKEIDAGNIGSDLGLFVRPIENLTIAAGLDYASIFTAATDLYNLPLVNFGAEYVVADMVGFGVAARNVLNDDRSFGVYASFIGVEGLTVNAGFSYNAEFADVKGNLLSAALMFEKDALGINLDAVFGLGGEADDGFKLYTGLEVTYQLSDPFGIGLVAIYKSDFADQSVIGANPYVKYAINENHEVSAGVCIEVAEATTITIPVYWKFSF